MYKKFKVPDPYEIEDGGVIYYSQNHARYGKYFENAKADFNYCAGFSTISLPTGERFSPTGYLENVLVQGPEEEYRIKKLWVKIDGTNRLDPETVNALIQDSKHPVLLLSMMPNGDEEWLEWNIKRQHIGKPYLYSFLTIDGSDAYVYLGITKHGEFKLFRPDSVEPKDLDRDRSVQAYIQAYKAFKKGKNIKEESELKKKVEQKTKQKAKKKEKVKVKKARPGKEIKYADSAMDLFNRSLSSFKLFSKDAYKKRSIKNEQKHDKKDQTTIPDEALSGTWPPQTKFDSRFQKGQKMFVPSVLNKKIRLERPS